MENALSNVLALLEIQKALILAHCERQDATMVTDPLPLSPRAAAGLHNLVNDSRNQLLLAYEGEPDRAGGAL